MAKTKTRLNLNQRKRIVKGLVANCEGLADAGEATLFKLSDAKLIEMARNVAARKAEKLKKRLAREEGGTRNKQRKTGNKQRQPVVNSAEKRRKQRLQARRRRIDNDESEGQDDEQDPPSRNRRKGGKPIRKKAALNSRSPISEREYLRAAPPGIRRMLQRLTRNERKQKETLVDRILDNENNQFTEKFLMKKSVPELQAIVRLANSGQEEDDGDQMFIGAATPARNSRAIDDRQEDILPLPTINWGPEEEEDDEDDDGDAVGNFLDSDDEPRRSSRRKVKKTKRRQRA